MSPAGTSVYSPMWRCSSVMNDWQKRMTSSSERPFGSKSEPPLPPPIGMPVSAFLKTCSKPRNLTMPSVVDGWNRSPPLYGPRALLNSTRKPRLICTSPRSSVHGTRKMICRSGSQMRSSSFCALVLRVLRDDGPDDLQDLVDGLVELRLRGAAPEDDVVDVLQLLVERQNCF